MSDFSVLPPGLPAPEDDGACDHLPGAPIPSISLPATDGGTIDLRQATRGRCVLYFYPRTGTPGVPLPEGWDLIPGARGCTPQACGFRDHAEELKRYGADVLGVSVQTPAEQLEFAERVHLPFPLLSDPALRIAHAMELPTFEVEGAVLYKRCAFVVEASTITTVFYPVFPPDRNAEDVLAWLAESRRRT